MKRDFNLVQVNETTTTAYNASVSHSISSFRELNRNINLLDKWFKTESTYLILLSNSVLSEYQGA